MSDWKRIFRDAVSGVAGVVVYDKGQADGLGRYVVAKTMNMGRRNYIHTQCYFTQRPAALLRAKKFLEQRASMAGKTYTPGDGANTIAFKPVGVTP